MAFFHVSDQGWSRCFSVSWQWQVNDNELCHWEPKPCQLSIIFVVPSDQMQPDAKKTWKRWCRQFLWLRGSYKVAKCATCSDFSCKVPKKSQLAQHEKCKVHLAKGQMCPSASDFDKMLSERMQGTSLRKSSFGSFKATKMLFCLNEAVKDLLKKRVKKLITASISQDGQGATVGIRMCLVSHDDGNLGSVWTALSLVQCLTSLIVFAFLCIRTVTPQRPINNKHQFNSLPRAFPFWFPRTGRWDLGNFQCSGFPEKGTVWIPQLVQSFDEGFETLLYLKAEPCAWMVWPGALLGSRFDEKV